MSESPWTFHQARQKALDAERAQKDAEDHLHTTWRKYAEAERIYRRELAKRLLKLKASGESATLSRDLARGAEDISNLKELRDIAEGARDAAQVAVWRHKDNRKDARGFAEWSERREMAEGYGQVPGPDWSTQPVHGAGTPAHVDPQTGEITASRAAA